MIPSLLTMLALAACGPKPAVEAAADEPQADAEMVAEAVAGAAEAAAATHPLCELVTFAEIQAAGAGNVSQLDVIDSPDSNHVDCVYIDRGDYLGAGMSITFTSSEKLAKKAASPWSTAAEFSRNGRAAALR